MNRTTPVAAWLFLGSALGFAGNWSGYLVDAKCYEAEERNMNATTTLQAVNRDRDEEIRYCRPKPKTKSFEFVDHDGMNFKLDSSGNARAAELVRNLVQKHGVAVSVTGEKSENTIKIDSISLLR